MKLDEWRKKKTEAITLPSGLEVVLKRVGLMDLLVLGEIPNTLYGQVEQLLSADVVVRMSDFPIYADTLNLICRACLVEPPLAEKGDEEHLGQDELNMGDKIAIFNWANGGGNALLSFFPETDAGAVTPPGG